MGKIINKTRKEVLAVSYRSCRSIRSKARGLMLTLPSSVLDNSLVFEFDAPAHQSMHMFLVFYPIDVLFLDGNKRVVDMKERFLPFTIYNSKVLSKHVIELPAGRIRQSSTAVGDVVAW
ncbi:MAG: DUF192 domain-containing protein [Candidatus Woesearchaeota archaeon]